MESMPDTGLRSDRGAALQEAGQPGSTRTLQWVPTVAKLASRVFRLVLLAGLRGRGSRPVKWCMKAATWFLDLSPSRLLPQAGPSPLRSSVGGLSDEPLPLCGDGRQVRD